MIYGWWWRPSEEVVADTEGFEPSVEGLPLRLLSREVVSAAHPRVRMVWPEPRYSEGIRAPQCQIDRWRRFRTKLLKIRLATFEN